jgi:RNA polymerase sigma-70 factor, ECF subfamily
MHYAELAVSRRNGEAAATNGAAALGAGDAPASNTSPDCDPTLSEARSALDRQLKMVLPRLRRYALTLTRDPVDADDLVQDCVARALVKLHLWQPGTDLRAWLVTILHNEHVNRIRHERMTGAKVKWSEYVTPATCQSAQLDYVELTELCRNIMRLTRGQRTAILMASLSPCNYGQIAAACDVPVGTIRSRLGRGRAILRELAETPPRVRTSGRGRAAASAIPADFVDAAE